MPPRHVVGLRLSDRILELETEPGMFSWQHVDPGTLVLLRYAPLPPDDDVLDLGCGYGPISLALAARAPETRVWAIDTDARARRLTARNAARAGLGNVVVRAPEDVPRTIRFSALYSNPPGRIGRDAQRAVLARWLDRLTPDGEAHLVVKRSMGADSLAAWLRDAGFHTVRARSSRGYRLLRLPIPLERDRSIW